MHSACEADMFITTHTGFSGGTTFTLWLVDWLIVFYVPSTARSFRDGISIYCPLRRTLSSINTPFRPGIDNWLLTLCLITTYFEKFWTIKILQSLGCYKRLLMKGVSRGGTVNLSILFVDHLADFMVLNVGVIDRLLTLLFRCFATLCEPHVSCNFGCFCQV